MKKLKGLFGLVVVFAIFYACTKNANTKTNYVYKSIEDKELAAKFKGKVIRKDELFQDIRDDIYRKEVELYELKFGKLKSFVLEHLVTSDPRKKGLTDQQFLDKYITNKVKPTKAEINAFVEERKIPKSQLTDDMKKRIESYLSSSKKKDAIDNWLNEQIGKSPIEVYLKRPERPFYNVAITDQDPSWGDKEAKVTIVEYSDFQCPFCSKGADRIKEIKKKYGKKIRVVFKHFPLPFHHHAKKAAMATSCINEQGSDKFWKAHDYLFANQDKITQESLLGLGSKFSLNAKKYEECFKSEKYAKKVEADIAGGKTIFVKSTPTFFINGRLLSGARPIEDFVQEINKFL